MAFKLGIAMIIHNKDDIEFITEFPCFLGHPVQNVQCQKEIIYFTPIIQYIVQCTYVYIRFIYSL